MVVARWCGQGVVNIGNVSTDSRPRRLVALRPVASARPRTSVSCPLAVSALSMVTRSRHSYCPVAAPGGSIVVVAPLAAVHACLRRSGSLRVWCAAALAAVCRAIALPRCIYSVFLPALFQRMQFAKFACFCEPSASRVLVPLPLNSHPAVPVCALCVLCPLCALHRCGLRDCVVVGGRCSVAFRMRLTLRSTYIQHPIMKTDRA